jgi:hypothetical protein
MGNSSIRRGRATMEEPLFARFGISLPQGDHPEDAQGLLDVVLPGFCPAVYPFVRDCLSRTSRPPKQTGTLDAHFIYSTANAVPNASRLLRAHECCGKHRGLGVVPASRNSDTAAARHRLRTMSGQSPTTAPQIRARLARYSAAPSHRGAVAAWIARALESMRARVHDRTGVAHDGIEGSHALHGMTRRAEFGHELIGEPAL